jgi:hypothetical protein
VVYADGVLFTSEPVQEDEDVEIDVSGVQAPKYLQSSDEDDLEDFSTDLDNCKSLWFVPVAPEMDGGDEGSVLGLFQTIIYTIFLPQTRPKLSPDQTPPLQGPAIPGEVEQSQLGRRRDDPNNPNNKRPKNPFPFPIPKPHNSQRLF